MLWNIINTSVSHHLSNCRDYTYLNILKNRFISPEYMIDVWEGIRFPGLYGDNSDYKNLYANEFNNQKVFCAPRGNIQKHNYVVMGIAPGPAEDSEILREPMWLFGNSSSTLHKLLRANDIYPYFTDVLKEPFKDKDGNYTTRRPYSNKQALSYLKPYYDVLTQELAILEPSVVIILGKGSRYEADYEFIKSWLDDMNTIKPNLFNWVNIEHPGVHGLTDFEREQELRQALSVMPEIKIPVVKEKRPQTSSKGYPFNNISIHLVRVDEIDNKHHGVEIYFQSILVGFVKNFEWLQSSCSVEISLLKNNSEKFNGVAFNGRKITKLAYECVEPYIITALIPPDGKKDGEQIHFGTNC